MKKSIAAILLFMMLFMVGCAGNKTIEYKDSKTNTVSKITFQPYGIFDDEKRNPNIYYSLSWGNIFWSVVFSETLIIPGILCGFYLWEPQYQIDNPGIIGSVN